VKLSDARLLSFDCYGTLIDWELGICTTVSRLLEPYGATPTSAHVLALFASHETHVQDAHPTWTYPQILAETWRRMAESLDLPGDAANGPACDADAAAFAASVPDWPAFPDSHDALLALQSRCKLVILSNVDNASFAGSRARLDVQFDAILTAQDIGSYKPDPRNFQVLLRTAKDMGVELHQHLHVAQSLFHDHVPAQAAGLHTVWINRYGATRVAATDAATPTTDAGTASTGATPASVPVTPHWEFPTLQAFADALLSGR
jgi:2-haloacid dehalogenase